MTGLALAIGTFDGVHLGHRSIIDAAQASVGADGDVMAVTFWPHPLSVLKPESAPPLLQGAGAREDALLAAGADEILVLEFTAAFAAEQPGEFVERVLVPLEPSAVAIGESFTFGARGAGTPETLRQLAAGRFDVITGPTVEVNGCPVSSSRIRALVQDGGVREAAGLLGRDFAVRGVVVHGDHRGRTLGFPTANLNPPESLVTPADGVYAGWLRRLDEESGLLMPAAVSVGDNPTFGSSRRVEAHVLDADLDLYGVEVEIGFAKWLRGMVAFDGVDQLVAQLRDDVAATREEMSDSPTIKGTW